MRNCSRASVVRVLEPVRPATPPNPKHDRDHRQNTTGPRMEKGKPMQEPPGFKQMFRYEIQLGDAVAIDKVILACA